MVRLTFILLIIHALGCHTLGSTEQEKPRVYADLDSVLPQDSLWIIQRDSIFEFGMPCGYIDEKGDTIIPYGRYQYCFTPIFYTYAIVADSALTGNKLVALDRKGRIIFDIYLFDNFPDEASEGLFRIKRNGLVGYANELGQVVIPPAYECANQFRDGQASVADHCELVNDDFEHWMMKSDEWYSIDKSGAVIQEDH